MDYTELKRVSSDGRFVCQYCEPIDVMRAIRIVDYYSADQGILVPSDVSLPSYDELIFRICAKEDEIDRFTRRSWRENRVKDYVCSINEYWHDNNSSRTRYWQEGGYFIQLHKDVLPWNPNKGDKIELRNISNQFIDVTEAYMREADLDEPNGVDKKHEMINSFWFDYPMGKLYIRSSFVQPKHNSIRITYRYGKEGEVPASISRCCALMVALTVLNEDFYLTRLGSGGDLGSSKADMRKNMETEINNILTMYRRTGAVYSLFG